MERMKKRTNFYDAIDKIQRQDKYIEYLEKENKNLKECNLNLQEWIDNKEKVNKSLREENKKLREELSIYDREYFDEDKKAKNIFMEEDTLQELRDIGEI